MEILVRTDEIKERGLSLDRELPLAELAAVLAAEPPTGFEPTAPAQLHARLEKVNETDVVAKGGLELALRTECRRCLAPVELRVPVDFALDFVNRERVPEAAPAAEDRGEGEVAGSFTPGEADQIPYAGKQLDLGPAVREQILLALPMDALCREACLGLCQICGGNLNESTCSCDRHVPDPRWAKLKNLKLS